jgi:heterodisulfide reductase subunit C
MKNQIIASGAIVSKELAKIEKMVRACIQCGTCSGSCPNAFAMDITPRQLWRMVQMGCETAIFQSRTFTLCSSCHYCTLRCPRGLPLNEAMAALKQMATRQELCLYRKSTLFYQNFVESVRRHGRVRELEFMTLYFAKLKHPLLPLRFASMGMKLARKGKLPIHFPSKGQGKLNAIFKKTKEMER